MNQAFIALFSLAALTMFQSRHAALRRWGSVVGLAGQPFWLYSTWEARLWGVFFTSTLYTGVYMWGIYNNFYRR